MDLTHFREWDQIMLERRVIKAFRDQKLLGQRNLAERHADIADYIEPILGMQMVNIFELPNIYTQIKIANAAFESILREPKGVMHFVGNAYFIHLVQNANPERIELHHIWRSVTSDMMGQERIPGGVFEHLLELVKNHIVLIIDHPTEGSLRMFETRGITVFDDPERTKTSEEGETLGYVNVSDMLQSKTRRQKLDPVEECIECGRRAQYVVPNARQLTFCSFTCFDKTIK